MDFIDIDTLARIGKRVKKQDEEDDETNIMQEIDDYLGQRDRRLLGEVDSFGLENLDSNVGGITRVRFSGPDRENVEHIEVRLDEEMVDRVPPVLSAGILVHELKHVEQALEGRFASHTEAEKELESLDKEAEFLRNNRMESPDAVDQRLGRIDELREQYESENLRPVVHEYTEWIEKKPSYTIEIV